MSASYVIGANISEIYNFLEIDAGLVTGGQPSEEELASLARAGYGTIINLGLHDDPRYSLKDEPGIVVLASETTRNPQTPNEVRLATLSTTGGWE
jgi:hypothetical protein